MTILLVLPGSSFPEKNWMNQFQVDKWIHIFLFALLVILWVRALGKKYPKKIYHMKIISLVGCGAASYGVLMEFVQLYFVNNRSFELKDIVADVGGVIIGSLANLMGYIKK